MECPICTEHCDTIKICDNSHQCCKTCILKWSYDHDTCPICRSSIKISGPYSSNFVQHRYDNYSEWENYCEKDNQRIINQLNLKPEGGALTLQVNDKRFIIYWGSRVTENIVCSNSPIHTLQINELKLWKDDYNNYGYNNGIIVQRNLMHTGMRLVRLNKN